MRVLFAQAHPRDARLGSPKSVLRLGAALARLGIDVRYLFAGDQPDPLPGPRGRELGFPLLVARAVRAWPCDVLDAASSSGVLWALRRRVRQHPPAVVARVLGLEHTAWARTRPYERLTWRYRLWAECVRLPLVALALRAADRVACLSQADAHAVVGRGWQPAERVAVIPPGIDQALLEAPDDAPRAGALYVGAWTARKGADVLVRAYVLARRACPDLALTLAGTWQPAERVLAAFPSAVRDGVRVLPPLAEEDLQTCYQQHALLLLPSRYEGFGLVVLEALASGLPVVATRTGGAADLVVDGVNGYLVPPNDPVALAQAWLSVANDAARRRRMGAAARATARPYTWERAAEQTLALYNATLS